MFPVNIVFCAIGVISINNTEWDVFMMAVFSSVLPVMCSRLIANAGADAAWPFADDGGTSAAGAADVVRRFFDLCHASDQRYAIGGGGDCDGCVTALDQQKRSKPSRSEAVLSAHRERLQDGKVVVLPSGEKVPALGMGTWMMGEDHARRSEEIATLVSPTGFARFSSIPLKCTAKALREARSARRRLPAGANASFWSVGVYPHNAGRETAQLACERSLKRLGVDCLDPYLLHWRSSTVLAETIEAFESLKAQGKIRHWGVSNFDAYDIKREVRKPRVGRGLQPIRFYTI